MHTSFLANPPDSVIIIETEDQTVPEIRDLVALALDHREGSAGSAVILVPGQGEDPARIGALASVSPALVTATHGSPLAAGAVLLLPSGRHFVLENGCLALRPPTLAGGAAPLGKLLASLGELTARSKLVRSPQAQPHAATDAAISAFLEAGGRAVQPAALAEALRNLTLPPEPREPATSPLHASLAHEVRQPLQTLVLLHSLLRRQAVDARQIDLLGRMGETLAQLGAILSAPQGQANRPALGAGASTASGDPDTRPGPLGEEGARPLVFVIDDDPSIRAAMREVLEAEGSEVRDFGRCEDFLEAYGGETLGCLLIDAYLPGMSGLDLLQDMGGRGHPLPSILMTGSSDVQMAVSAMKMGASDFLEKPVTAQALIACVKAALARAKNTDADQANREKAVQALNGLTRRQRQIMTMVLDGHPSKNIAADLGISQRTVENHRAAIMRKTGSRSLPQLARLILALPHGEIE